VILIQDFMLTNGFFFFLANWLPCHSPFKFIVHCSEQRDRVVNLAYATKSSEPSCQGWQAINIPTQMMSSVNAYFHVAVCLYTLDFIFNNRKRRSWYYRITEYGTYIPFWWAYAEGKCRQWGEKPQRHNFSTNVFYTMTRIILGNISKVEEPNYKGNCYLQARYSVECSTIT